MNKNTLKDITVVDISNNLPGPYCSYLLKEQGANIIKVESPKKADPARLLPRFFEKLNDDKKITTLDYASGSDREKFIELVKKADVIIESGKPGVAKKLGVDFNELKKYNKRIIYCSITGYGQNTNKSVTPAHDINLQAEAGIYSLSNKPQSSIFPLPIADMTASQTAYSKIILSLLEVKKHGDKAIFLDVSMGETLTEMVSIWKSTIPTHEDLAKLLSKSKWRSTFSSGNPITNFIKSKANGEPLSKLPHYGLFYCKDNIPICIGIVDEQHFWSSLCEHLGGLLKYHKKANLKRRVLFAPFYKMLIRKRIKRKNASYWLDVMKKLPISEVN